MNSFEKEPGGESDKDKDLTITWKGVNVGDDKIVWEVSERTRTALRMVGTIGCGELERTRIETCWVVGYKENVMSKYDEYVLGGFVHDDEHLGVVVRVVVAIGDDVQCIHVRNDDLRHLSYVMT